MPIDTDRFVFRQHDTVGAIAAEDDSHFLVDCFVDAGPIAALRDCSNPRRILLGRTGSGKSALLIKLKNYEDRIVEIRPQSLALSYLSNSTILQFLSTLGVRLDVFFRLLWRHVLTIELLKRHFDLQDENAASGIFAVIQSLLKGKRHRQALQYLRDHGASFWKETDYRIKEITSKFEGDIAASIGIPISDISGSAAAKLSFEQRAELIDRAQKVVNAVQVSELQDILPMLDEVLDDPQKPYHLTIDQLDEDWIEESLRYRLLRALLETVRDFRQVRNAKVICAMRVDLFQKVAMLTRDAGFQEEKFDSVCLHLDWSKEHLELLLNKRVNHLVRQRYTKQPLTYRDLLPPKIDGDDVFDYVLNRTLMRPRDVISFFNSCITQATDRPKISHTQFRAAVGEYSRGRLKALADEWFSLYPNLMLFTDLLKNRPSTFVLSDLSDEAVTDFALKAYSNTDLPPDDFSLAAKQCVEDLISPAEFRRIVSHLFYKVGLIGLRLRKGEALSWSYNGRHGVSSAEIDDNVRVQVHAFAHRVLGIGAEAPKSRGY